MLVSGTPQRSDQAKTNTGLFVAELASPFFKNGIKFGTARTCYMTKLSNSDEKESLLWWREHSLMTPSWKLKNVRISQKPNLLQLSPHTVKYFFSKFANIYRFSFHFVIFLSTECRIMRERIKLDCLRMNITLHYSLLSWIPPASSCSTICFICVQLYSPVTQGWEGGFSLISTLWQLHGLEVTFCKSKIFTPIALF